MPIRFLCEHCQQRLSVGSRKAGDRARCPKCKQSVTVPHSQQEADEQARGLTGDAHPTSVDESTSDPYSQFAVFDDDEDVEWVYDDPVGELDDRPRSADRVAVPRRVIYVQGGLLGAVAVLGFLLGWGVGRVGSGGAAAPTAPQPCVVSGRLTYQAENGSELPDEGAVVIVVPQDAVPESGAPISGLLPAVPAPRDTDPGIQALQSIGGRYTRADLNGQFQFEVADTGKYFVLFLSQHSTRPASEPPERQHLAEMGRFLTPATDLLGDRRYRWEAVTLRRDRTWNVVFK